MALLLVDSFCLFVCVFVCWFVFDRSTNKGFHIRERHVPFCSFQELNLTSGSADESLMHKNIHSATTHVSVQEYMSLKRQTSNIPSNINCVLNKIQYILSVLANFNKTVPIFGLTDSKRKQEIYHSLF